MSKVTPSNLFLSNIFMPFYRHILNIYLVLISKKLIFMLLIISVLFSSLIFASKVKVLVTQSCLTFCDPMDCSLPGSSIQGILQARILEWVAVPSSRGSSPPRDQTYVSCGSCIAGRFFTTEPPGNPLWTVLDLSKLC